MYVSDEMNNIISSKKTNINFDKLTESELLPVLSASLESETIFKTSTIFIDTACYTIIPVHVFSVEDYEPLLKFQHTDFDSNTQVLLTSEIHEQNILIVFSCSKAIYNALIAIYSKTDIQHALSTQFIDTSHNLFENTIKVIVSDAKLDIIAFKNQQLILVNTFEYSTNEDFLYHLVHVKEQLKFEDTQTQVEIKGKKTELELENLLTKYIHNIRFN